MPNIVVMGLVPPMDRMPAYLHEYHSPAVERLLYGIPEEFYGMDVRPYQRPSMPGETAVLRLGAEEGIQEVVDPAVALHYPGQWLTYEAPPSWSVEASTIAQHGICAAATAYRQHLHEVGITSGLPIFLPSFYLVGREHLPPRRYTIA